MGIFKLLCIYCSFALMSVNKDKAPNKEEIQNIGLETYLFGYPIITTELMHLNEGIVQNTLKTIPHSSVDDFKDQSNLISVRQVISKMDSEKYFLMLATILQTAPEDFKEKNKIILNKLATLGISFGSEEGLNQLKKYLNNEFKETATLGIKLIAENQTSERKSPYLENAKNAYHGNRALK